MDQDDEFPPDLVEADEPTSSPDRIVPITLLTGYLGSGKTTLLNYILEADHGYRIAVCMNDFGDSTDIESTAMSFTPTQPPPSTSTSDAQPEESSSSQPPQPQTTFLSLPNGCLCCSIKEPGIAAIENMIEEQGQVEGSGGKGIDRVVVELTGVADPAEIARSFWTNEEMGGKLRLDGVVCVVDSRNVIRQLEDGEECQKQIAASDVILLNKVDLVTDDHLDLVEGRIRLINPTATFKRTHRSVIDIGNIFDIAGYSVASTLDAMDVVGRLEGTSTRDRIEALGGHGHGHGQGQGHEHEHGEEENHDHASPKKHLEGISSLVIDLPVLPSDSLDRLDAFLRSIHWDSVLPTSDTNDTKVAGAVASSSSADPSTGITPSKVDDVDSSDEPDESSMGLEILRTKGIFTLDNDNGDDANGHRQTYVLQGVRDLFELNQLNRVIKPSNGDSLVDGHGRSGGGVGGGVGEEAVLNRSKLVVIGKRLGRREDWEEALREGLGLGLDLGS